MGEGERAGEVRTLSKDQRLRRERLIDSARELALEGGYAAVTMHEVADRAGVGRATVYRYFTMSTAIGDPVPEREDVELVLGHILLAALISLASLRQPVDEVAAMVRTAGRLVLAGALAAR